MGHAPQPFPGLLVADLHVFGQRVDVFVEPVGSEVRRRRVARMAPIGSGGVLRALMGLPHLHPVPLADVDPLDRLVLADLPEAALRTEGPTVTRLAVPPVQLNGFVKHATAWEDVQAATLLRTHAPRLVVAVPRLATRVLREADPDIGVAHTAAGALHIRRAPGRRWLKPSWQRWLIAEAAFGALLDARLPEDVGPGR